MDESGSISTSNCVHIQQVVKPDNLSPLAVESRFHPLRLPIISVSLQSMNELEVCENSGLFSERILTPMFRKSISRINFDVCCQGPFCQLENMLQITYQIMNDS
ncbi:uncharacterized protein LOC113563897 [Drosophila erecta]|uniref:uncharacterized protein LOC113563897 n=1 Tax=Drosophila erecta TaxID=7220 RepID=UPI000F070314|nr:uncharacterized protein LOC113563897 [Drosophila erecta]